MKSKFSGVCKACNRKIATGEQIDYHGRGNGVSCAQCAAMTDRPAPTPYVNAWTREAKQAFVPDRFDMQVEDNMRDACGLGL